MDCCSSSMTNWRKRRRSGDPCLSTPSSSGAPFLSPARCRSPSCRWPRAHRPRHRSSPCTPQRRPAGTSTDASVSAVCERLTFARPPIALPRRIPRSFRVPSGTWTRHSGRNTHRESAMSRAQRSRVSDAETVVLQHPSAAEIHGFLTCDSHNPHGQCTNGGSVASLQRNCCCDPSRTLSASLRRNADVAGRHHPSYSTACILFAHGLIVRPALAPAEFTKTPRFQWVLPTRYVSCNPQP